MTVAYDATKSIVAGNTNTTQGTSRQQIRGLKSGGTHRPHGVGLWATGPRNTFPLL
jgi:hypothetical protein